MIVAIIKWVSLALLGVVVTLANVLLSPIVALFICGDGYLPRWLGWFQTPDNPAIGDKAFQLNQMPWTLRLPDWLARYFLCIGWAWRNPAYGYDQWAGFPVVGSTMYWSRGNERVNIARDAKGVCHVTEGWVLRRFVCQGRHYFQFTALYRWNNSRAWRISFGWTLSIWDVRSGNRCRINTTINPWMDCR